MSEKPAETSAPLEPKPWRRHLKNSACLLLSHVSSNNPTNANRRHFFPLLKICRQDFSVPSPQVKYEVVTASHSLLCMHVWKSCSSVYTEILESWKDRCLWACRKLHSPCTLDAVLCGGPQSTRLSQDAQPQASVCTVSWKDSWLCLRAGAIQGRHTELGGKWERHKGASSKEVAIFCKLLLVETIRVLQDTCFLCCS